MHRKNLNLSGRLRLSFSLDLVSRLSYHDKDLWFAFLGQINDVHSIIIEIFEAAAKIFMWECHCFSVSGNPSEADLRNKKNDINNIV